MSLKEILVLKDLFLIEDAGGRYILYAPLADSALPVSGPDLERIRKVMDGCVADDTEVRELLNELTAVEPVENRHGYVRTEADFLNLSLLPTNKCNFSCSYCYSAEGRSSETITPSRVKAAIDWFSERDKSPLRVTIFGGGEPMLTWEDIVKPTITYIKGKDKNIGITLITNGSILPDDFAAVCRQAAVDVVVSFEILESLQQRHRRNYSIVKHNILRMIADGVNPRINCVITEEAVRMMPAMIGELSRELKGIDYVSLEPAVGDHTGEYYEIFTEKFFEARSVGAGLGIEVSTSALRNCDVTVDRYCAGELALTAAGDLSLCPCIASVAHPDYSRWLYGRVESDGVKIDSDKLAAFLAQRVQNQPWCRKCFAKYNCGGGCQNRTAELGHKPDRAFCQYMRNFLKIILLKRLDDAWTGKI